MGNICESVKTREDVIMDELAELGCRRFGERCFTTVSQKLSIDDIEFLFVYNIGNVKVGKLIWELASILNVRPDIQRAFTRCCLNGYIDYAKWLWNLSKENNRPIDIHANNEDLFKFCCMFNNINMAQWLYKLSLEINSPIDIRAGNDEAFIHSARNKYMPIANWLCTLCPDYYFDKDGIERIRKSIYDILENKNNIDELKKYLTIIPVSNKLICLICHNNHDKIISLGCDAKYEHYYCIDCFCKWYAQNQKKCLICQKKFETSQLLLHTVLT